jgi:hypothetical protein
MLRKLKIATFLCVVAGSVLGAHGPAAAQTKKPVLSDVPGTKTSTSVTKDPTSSTGETYRTNGEPGQGGSAPVKNQGSAGGVLTAKSPPPPPSPGHH